MGEAQNQAHADYLLAEAKKEILRGLDGQYCSDSLKQQLAESGCAVGEFVLQTKRQKKIVEFKVSGDAGDGSNEESSEGPPDESGTGGGLSSKKGNDDAESELGDDAEGEEGEEELPPSPPPRKRNRKKTGSKKNDSGKKRKK